MDIVTKSLPRVSVIIATFNWSKALKLSLTSALQQTVKDIEIIVVGDGCTDDSEQLVTAFNDNRLRWIGLPNNSGSQAMPNNRGIREARADHVAYLGHDDIWHPTHLELLLKTQQNTQADYVYSGAILYGPPDTDIRMVTGFPYRNIPQRTHFAPPTTVMHRHDLAEKIGGWRMNHEVSYPVDYDFQLRAWDCGAVFAATGRVTAFKFPAAWWRDSYKMRDVSRQQDLLSRINTDPDLIEKELVQVAKAADHGMFLQTGAPCPLSEGKYFLINSLVKGTREPENSNAIVAEKVRFSLDKAFYAFEWHGLERTSEGTIYQWTGPRTESSLDIPIATDGDMKMEMHILFAITPEALDGLRLLINNQRVRFTMKKHEMAGWSLTCDIPANIAQSGAKNNIRVTLKTPQTVAPVELDPHHQDRRRLGLAVSDIEMQRAELVTLNSVRIQYEQLKLERDRLGTENFNLRAECSRLSTGQEQLQAECEKLRSALSDIQSSLTVRLRNHLVAIPVLGPLMKSLTKVWRGG